MPPIGSVGERPPGRAKRFGEARTRAVQRGRGTEGQTRQHGYTESAKQHATVAGGLSKNVGQASG